MPNATTHTGNNDNPVDYKRGVFPLQVGLIGRSKDKGMAPGNNGGGGGNQTPSTPTWNHLANMDMDM